MNITKLELENWMKIRRLVLEFDRGINLVYGPNEIGKSSIIEAVRQAITGDAGSGAVQYRQLQTWGTDAAARVDLWFTTRSGEDYRICKSFPGGGAGLDLPPKSGMPKLESNLPIKYPLKPMSVLCRY